jgi:hypothetical protein
MSQSVSDNDWRLMGQARYLSGATFHWRTWHETLVGWDHDHCEFCFTKISNRPELSDAVREGYATADQSCWVCATRAADFGDRFSFTLVGGPGRKNGLS